MIRKLIQASVENKALVMILTAVVVALGIWAMLDIRLDAIPDLSDVQVIVVTEFPGQAPEVVEDQVTYPLTTAMLSVPGSKAVRGLSMYELSMVYILFEDGTDLYWARSRVLEYLNFARDRLPAGVEPKLGPDATSLGWVYQYALIPGWYCPDHPAERGRDAPGTCPRDGKPLVAAEQDLAQLRSLQDWYLRYELTSLDGVSEVAAFGGFVKEYQVVLEPEKLRAYGIPLQAMVEAIRRSNNEVGGSVLEMAENEYMVRSRGYLRGLSDLAEVVVGLGDRGVPVRLSEVARLEVAGQARRGIGEWNGRGEAVGAVVIARSGENAFKVIAEVKEKLSQLEAGLPPGVSIRATYDRSALIQRSIDTLRTTLIEEMVVVGLMCMLFLLHARSELVAIFVVPAGVLVSFLVMRLLGINANIMSLGGIAIAIGVMVDSSVVMVENAHKRLDREEERARSGEPPRPRGLVILEAAQEVGPSLFFSLLVITVSFLPVFTLGEESGRLFKPLAFTKTFAIAAGSLLAVTVVPVLMTYFITSRVLPGDWSRRQRAAVTLAAMLLPAAALALLPLALPALAPYRWWLAGGWVLLAGMLLVPQRIIHEERNPLSRGLQRLYQPAFEAAMRHRWLTLILALAALGSAVWPFRRLGSEFMPPLDEGDLLYMPTTGPSISVTKSREVLQQTDKLIALFPEVASVHGKIGRADTATDPAPLNMIETVVQLHTDPSRWRTRKVSRFFRGWPDWLRWPFAASFWPEERRITTKELVDGWLEPDGAWRPGLNETVKLPGVFNAWPYPIENRINMLATGVKSKLGIKIMGADLEELSRLADRTVGVVSTLPGTRSASTEPIFGGYYLDIDIRREAIARYGLTEADVQDSVRSSLGGASVTTTIEGLERYPVTVRYARELRDSIPDLEQLLVASPGGAQVPLGQLASFRINPGPTMIRSENSRPAAWIYVDIDTDLRDLGSYVTDARRAVATNVALPAGYTMSWSGQYEFAEKANRRLAVVVPITLALIVILLYLSTRSWFRVSVIMLAVPFSLVGAVWLLWLLGYHLSPAVWVGMIALAGLDAETGAVMLLYLDSSFERFRAEGRMRSAADLWAAVHDGAVKRIRPKFITVATDFVGLAPLLWATGTGSDVMRRLAAPMIGGLFSSFLMELLVYPVIFYLWKKRKEGLR